LEKHYSNESIFLLSFKTKKVRFFPIDLATIDKNAGKKDAWTSEMLLMWARYY